MDNFYNRLMPKLPLPKTEKEKKAREESNRRAREKLRENPNATTYLGMTGVGNNREFTNPAAPIASAYNNAGGGFSGIGGVLGAAGRTVANQAKDTFDAFAQPFMATSQGMVNNAISRYNLAKSVLPAAKNAASDVAKGVSSGYTGIPVDNSQADAIPVQPRPAAYPMSEVSGMDAAAPPQAPMPPMSFLERATAQKRYSPAEAREGQAAVMKAQGYSPLNQTFVAADGSKPANIFYQEKDGKTRYTIPGQKGVGGVPGYAEFQGQRQGGGSFSVLSGRTPEEQAAIDERVASINQQIDAQRIEQGQPTLAEEARMNAMANMVDRFASPPDNMNPQQMELWKLQQAQIANMMAQQAEQDKNQQINTAAQQKAALEQYRWQREQGVREQQAAGTEYDRGVTRQQAQKDYELRRQMYLSPQVDPIRREKVLTDAVNEYVGESAVPGEPPVFHGKAFADRYQVEPYVEGQAETGIPYYSEQTGDFVVVGEGGEIVPLRPEIVLAWKMAKGI